MPGTNIISPIDEQPDEDWDTVLTVNLTGAMQVLRAAAKKMKSTGSKGKVVNVSSIWGLNSKAQRSAYSASKTGLIGLTRAAAIDLASDEILVNALCPGFTKTELTESILSAEEMEQLAQDVPLGRFASVDEIAQAALFLCS